MVHPSHSTMPSHTDYVRRGHGLQGQRMQRCTRMLFICFVWLKHPVFSSHHHHHPPTEHTRTLVFKGGSGLPSSTFTTLEHKHTLVFEGGSCLRPPPPSNMSVHIRSFSRVVAVCN